MSPLARMAEIERAWTESVPGPFSATLTESDAEWLALAEQVDADAARPRYVPPRHASPPCGCLTCGCLQRYCNCSCCCGK